jgi:UDP-N-acetylmuramate--alanine ligase
MKIKQPSEISLHFVGVGGIGMSGIAEVFHNQGFRVSGTDLIESDTTRRLASLGIAFKSGHRAEHLDHADVVVISSAVRPDNPEVQEAKRRHIPVIPRAEMLGELMRGKIGFAVAGSHGKTTTTTLLAHVLLAANEDPTVVIGGKVDAIGGNAKLGQGRTVVAEADESDGSFLHLPATFAIVTNIDNDHLDHFGSLDRIEDAFVDFVAKLPFYGRAVVCADDVGIARCLKRFTKPVLTYGLSTREVDYEGFDVQIGANSSSFGVKRRGQLLGTFVIQMPGEHTVRNALAVVALADSVGIPLETIRKGLGAFAGVKRRFETRWQNPQTRQRVIDDYAHHPTEIVATLKAARRAWPQDRFLCIFQPHRFTRTQACFQAFVDAFQGVDELWLMDIYPAGEDPIPGIHSQALVESIQKKYPRMIVHHVNEQNDVVQTLLNHFRNGDVLFTLGAGSVTKIAGQLADRLSRGY